MSAQATDGESQLSSLALLDGAHWDEQDPARDGRVRWLLNELNDVCSSLALKHLCVDIMRERQGGRVSKTISIEVAETENDDRLRLDASQDLDIHERDTWFAWQGLIAMWQSEHRDRDDDVLVLLRALAEHSEIEAHFSGQWPIKAIVDLLNAQDRTQSWAPRRVDNAKEKLARWVANKKRGLAEFDDFEAILARVGRRLAEARPRTQLRSKT
jgi:hypothetical protein